MFYPSEVFVSTGDPFRLSHCDPKTEIGLAEFNHGFGICGLADRYLPGPGRYRAYASSVLWVG